MNDMRIFVDEEFTEPFVVIGEIAVRKRGHDAEQDHVVGEDKGKGIGVVVGIGENDLRATKRPCIKLLTQDLIRLLRDNNQSVDNRLFSFIEMDRKMLRLNRLPLEMGVVGGRKGCACRKKNKGGQTWGRGSRHREEAPFSHE
jgi:hypothetical protein